MKNIDESKREIEDSVRNSIWIDSTNSLTYKFQNEKDLWINGNNHVNYEFEIVEDRLILKLYPNGVNFFVELKNGILYLHDHKQNMEFRLRNKL